jgi:hypothetical protein
VSSLCLLQRPVEDEELARRKHFRRIQITADEIIENNQPAEIVTFNGTWMTIDEFLDGQTLDSRLDQVLADIDNPNQSCNLVKVGYLLAKQPTTQTILREFVETFLLEIPK